MTITDDDLSDSDDSIIVLDPAVPPLTGPQRLERLRSLRERFDWGLQAERRALFGKFKTLIWDWTDHLPDLRDFFARDEIDWMLGDFVLDYDIETLPFFEFVHATGYRDAPYVDEAGEPTRLRRATALHLALDQVPHLRKEIALKLFEIYDSYDANYENEHGQTHFHVACELGCADIVEKFLDLGQNPDLPVGKTGKTPLQLAVLAKQRDVVEALLDHGADPNLVDKSGQTVLHSACTVAESDDVEVAAIIDTMFEICTERRRTIAIDAQDKKERTALHLALLAGQRPIVEALLRWGADPNRSCPDGNASAMTYLHIICRIRGGDDRMAELFLETVGDIGRSVAIDARDTLGWTPLHYALYYGKRKTIESLLKWGADPNARLTSGGFAPVHHLAHRQTEEDLAAEFFRIVRAIGERVEVDAVDDQGWTALLAALNRGNAKAFEALLLNGADPNLSRSENGSTALHRICKGKDDDHVLLKRLFEICVDKRKIEVLVDARVKDGWTPLHLAVREGKRKMAEVLLRRGANPNLTRENGSTALHTVCKRLGDDEVADDAGDLVTMIFELCSEAHKPLLVDARDQYGWTPLNLALYYRNARVVEALLRGGADPNLIHAKGLTSLHLVCQGKTDDELPEIFLRQVEAIGKTTARIIDAMDETGKTPLQHTLSNAKRRHIEILLRRGADPNAADARGYTPLHSIACRKKEDDGLLEKFLEICGELRKTVVVDARDKNGWTPLHLALYRRHRGVMETLLRAGADPNSATRSGSTVLHIMAKKRLAADDDDYDENDDDDDDDDDLGDKFFEICDELGKEVRIVDAQDDLCWTPLNLALYHGNDVYADLLLRHGADSNLANWRGWTPLHSIAARKIDDGLAETFFRIIEDARATLRVDVKDKSRWTPLQLAVMHRLPRMVETLLTRGADLASFVFPNVICFERVDDHQGKGLKLREAARTMQVVQRLESRGFEVKRRHVVTIASFFFDHLALDASQRLESWHDDEDFASLAKEIAIRPSLTLYDLTRSRMPRVEPALAYEDYARLAEAQEFNRLAEEHVVACTTHLCEMMSADFFQRWGLDPFGGLGRTTTTTTNGSAVPSRRNHSDGEESQDAEVMPSPSKK
ncbi:ankyrin-3-like isoform X2 [Trichogramma pretiosum]|nr:ankyrin-3-like isoform X2 [Trichogramma pretiosum]